MDMETMSPPVSPSVVAAIFMIQNTRVTCGTLLAAVSWSVRTLAGSLIGIPLVESLGRRTGNAPVRVWHSGAARPVVKPSDTFPKHPRSGRGVFRARPDQETPCHDKTSGRGKPAPDVPFPWTLLLNSIFDSQLHPGSHAVNFSYPRREGRR